MSTIKRPVAMTSEKDSRELRQNWVDLTAAVGRGAASLVPFVGPFFAEVIGVTIPKQRLDRVVQFVTELERRLESAEREVFEQQLSSDEFTDLLEEGFRQASHSLSDERRSYIASLIINGMNSEQIDIAESKHLLRILGEINDIEVVWLRAHSGAHTLATTMGGDTFQEKHKEILSHVFARSRSTQREIDKEALQKSYKEHLAQLGLLTPLYKKDIQNQTPDFDSFTGAMEVRHYDLSRLGMMLLREIGLGEDESSS